MTRQEFLEQFEDALLDEVSNAVIYDNKQYYDRYINNEVRKGRNEEEVLEELGNPRLLAKTIAEMQTQNKQTAYQTYETYDENRQKEEYEKHLLDKVFQNLDLNTWFGRIITGVAGVLCLVVLISLISGILSIVISFLGPILLILFIVYLVKRLFKK